MLDQAKSKEVLVKRIKRAPQMVVVLGSGWNRVLTKVKVEAEVGFKEWLGVKASVPGHEGKLVVGKVGGKRVAFMSGRLHTYEGYSATEATLPIRVLASWGVKKIVLTSAVGALNEKYQVGDLVVLTDIISLMLSPDNPLVGPEFVDLYEAFDVKMRQVAKEVLVKEKVRFHEGVYVYYHGPNYETPADKMALRFLGADVVGMSTVPETIMARRLGAKVLGLALVTNLAFVTHSHKEVVAEAEKASKKMVGLLMGVVKGA